MGLSPVALRAQVLGVEHISEVLVGVQRPICQQLAVRARNGWLAADPILSIVSLTVLGRVALDEWCLELG